MKRIVFFVVLLLPLLLPLPAFAQSATGGKEIYSQAVIEKIVNQTTTISDGGYSTIDQTIQARFLDGQDKGKTITFDQTSDARLVGLTTYTAGQTVIIDKSLSSTGKVSYSISDTYRIPPLIILAIIFAIFTIVFAGKKGVGALLGLGVSLAVIIGYMIPQILFAKGNPLTVSIIGSTVILLATTFLAHGFRKQTVLAVVSTFLALIAAYLLAVFFVYITSLTGLGSEDSVMLQIGPAQAIDPKGLLLGGIIIGTLGALNDITTTQVATIVALFKANPQQRFGHLIKHGFEIGREHIVSLVNTLVLAYAGTSLPIFIFLILNPNHLPLWVMINNQQFGEEIVRAIAGSMGLMLSVPIATLLAAYFVPKIIKKPEDEDHRLHAHAH